MPTRACGASSTRALEHSSPGPLRGLKRDIFEGGHRVPFVVRWPGRVEAGAVSDALLGQTGLMRTIATIIGYELPKGRAPDSIDQGAVWTGQTHSVRSFHVHNTYKDRWAIRSGRWLLIDAKDGAHTRVPPAHLEAEGFAVNPHMGMLLDLSVDVGQHTNVFDEHADIVDRLRGLLAAERSR